MGVASSAIRRFHREDPQVAREYLVETFRRSPYWGASGPAQARGWAASIVESFDAYVELANGDTRRALGSTVTAEAVLGEHSVGVSLDVVLLDDEGYVARHVLWDVPELTDGDARLQAAPIVLALQAELGDDRVAGVEVWHLRSRKRVFVSRDEALGELDRVRSIVERYLQD